MNPFLHLASHGKDWSLNWRKSRTLITKKTKQTIFPISWEMQNNKMKSDCGLVGFQRPEGRIRMNKTLDITACKIQKYWNTNWQIIHVIIQIRTCSCVPWRKRVLWCCTGRFVTKLRSRDIAPPWGSSLKCDKMPCPSSLAFILHCFR